MKISKITYVIIICLFVGAFGSYLFRHYIVKNPKENSKLQVQSAATENPSNTHYTNNPINPSTGLPEKAEVLSTLSSGAIVYDSSSSTKPYGVLNSKTIVDIKGKSGDLYEITYDNHDLYISNKDITFNIA